MDIRYDKYSMIINGRRTFVRSGAMHYFRLPSEELWLDRLTKLKGAGYNTVDLYFNWGYHSRAEGEYDFTGVRNVDKLLAMARDLGLWVLARPGPYINAEVSGGGFPMWLLAKKDLPLRCRRNGRHEWSDEYIGYVREWWGRIIPIINRFDNVLMMQIENEYSTVEVDAEYMRALYQMARDLGVKVPLFHNDLFVAGLYADVVDIYAFDNYSVTQFDTNWREMPGIFSILDYAEQNLRQFCPDSPLMVAELQAGWFGTWKGHAYEKIIGHLGREHIRVSTKSLIGQGLTVFNHYKAIGGTNWDYIGSSETYTSYDFSAPISETGLPTERLYEAKALNYLLDSFDLTATEREPEDSLDFLPAEFAYAVRRHTERTGEQWIFLRNMDERNQTVRMTGDLEITVPAYELAILPRRVRLACGYTLTACSTEPFYQNDRMLILKGDRPVTAVFDTHGEVELDSEARLHIQRRRDGLYQLDCPALTPNDYRRFVLGGLTVLLMGQDVSDRTWRLPDGGLIMGPETPLADGCFGVLQDGTEKTLRQLDADGRVASENRAETNRSVPLPELTGWRVSPMAPELLQPAGFRPVSADGPDMDSSRLFEGSAWYHCALEGPQPKQIHLKAEHIWGAFLNGHYLAHGENLELIHGQEPAGPDVIPIPPRLYREDGPNDLLIFVNSLGHAKGFHDDQQKPQGLLSLRVDGEDLTGRLSIKRALDLDGPLAWPGGKPPAASPIVRMDVDFTLPQHDDLYYPVGVALEHMPYERINIYVNGVLMGRYWQACQGQNVFYLPRGVLKRGEGEENRLTLVCIHFDPFIDVKNCTPDTRHVRLMTYGVFQKIRV